MYTNNKQNKSQPATYNKGANLSNTTIDTLSIVSFVCAIASVLCFIGSLRLSWIFPFTIILSLSGIICGFISKKANEKRTALATSGIIISIIMLIIGIISAVFILKGLSRSSFTKDFDNLFKDLDKK